MPLAVFQEPVYIRQAAAIIQINPCNTKGYGYASDNSYTRIKDVSLSYSFSKAMLDKLKLGSQTCYVSGRNLYTFTKWIGWDPEHNYSFRGSGDWTNNYPITRQVVFGMNVTLR